MNFCKKKCNIPKRNDICEKDIKHFDFLEEYLLEDQQKKIMTVNQFLEKLKI